MEFDLLADGGLVLSDRLGNGRFCGAVGNAGKDDPSFFERQMGKSIGIVHADTFLSGGRRTR